MIEENRNLPPPLPRLRTPLQSLQIKIKGVQDIVCENK